MFAIKCYGFPEYPFTHFKECKTSRTAKKAAAKKLAEGWRIVEVLKRETTDWKLIKTIEREGK